MKKMKVMALALAAALCLGLLSGCGSFSASELVKSNLDLIYLDQYSDDYLKKVGLDKEQAEQQYEGGLEVEAEYFADVFSSGDHRRPPPDPSGRPVRFPDLRSGRALSGRGRDPRRLRGRQGRSVRHHQRPQRPLSRGLQILRPVRPPPHQLRGV